MTTHQNLKKLNQLWKQYIKKPSQNILAEIYDYIGEAEESLNNDKKILKKYKNKAKKESNKYYEITKEKMKSKGGLRKPRRKYKSKPRRKYKSK